MGSICPKCRTELDEDIVCCAELKHTWKCRKCGKRSTGFVIPYGRCYLCGGENETIEAFKSPDERATTLVQQALQMELDTFLFYRLARDRAKDAGQKAIFEQLSLTEREHLEEIEGKYHVHLDPEVLEIPPDREKLLASWIFQGIDFEAPDAGVEELYRRAISIEGRTRDHFLRRAEELPEGSERELCREFAAEEEEHIALLETELQHYRSADASA
jgi:rubrerythrin